MAAFLSRLAMVGVGLAAVLWLGFPAETASPPSGAVDALLSLPERWDTPWYVGLASHGYRWRGGGRFEDIAFFPAYPWLMGVVARGLGVPAGHGWAWLGVLLSTSLFAAALCALWHLAIRHVDASRARWSLLLCACSPFAIFFGLPYTESLSLLATTVLVLCAERGRFVPAIAAGLVAGLTRPTAAVLGAALVAGLLAEMAGRPRVSLHPPPGMATARRWAVALSPLMGIAIYSAYVHGLTGHPLSWALVQPAWGRPSQNPAAALAAPLVALIAHPVTTLLHTPHVALNTAAGVLALAVAWPVTTRLGVTQGTLVFAGTLVPLMAGGLASLGRYTSVLFPIYLWLAAVTPRRALPVVAAAFVCVQMVVAALFFTWRPMY